jgi:acetyl esterase/lipase
VNRRRALACAALAGLLVACARDPFDDPDYARVCASLPVHGAEARAAAAEQGYQISNRFDCVTRESHDAVARQNASNAKARAQFQAAARNPPPVKLLRTLSEARQHFSTQVSVPGNGTPYPRPPAELFVRSDYPSDGRKLAAFVTPDPRDGERHAAIVWLTGGDSSTLDDFWSEGAADNDQSASAFRKAGLVMMFPTLRGGNQNAGAHEFFLGEVDDVIAAANHLAKLGYVDPARIYLGGHSTGGTLALLTSETTSRFKAVFAFGAVAEVDRYPDSLVPGVHDLSREELELRSPLRWLHGISSPTWLIEGEDPPGNLGELQTLCARKFAPLQCIAVPGRNHFSALAPVTRVLAARIVGATDGRTLKVETADFAAAR